MNASKAYLVNNAGGGALDGNFWTNRVKNEVAFGPIPSLTSDFQIDTGIDLIPTPLTVVAYEFSVYMLLRGTDDNGEATDAFGTLFGNGLVAFDDQNADPLTRFLSNTSGWVKSTAFGLSAAIAPGAVASVLVLGDGSLILILDNNILNELQINGVMVVAVSPVQAIPAAPAPP